MRRSPSDEKWANSSEVAGSDAKSSLILLGWAIYFYFYFIPSFKKLLYFKKASTFRNVVWFYFWSEVKKIELLDFSMLDRGHNV